MLERADERRGSVPRTIKLPGGEVRVAATDAREIAAELRAKSLLGKREARLKAAEASLGR